MTINCTASVALAMYLALADQQGVAWDKLGGTMQNDMLKEFIAQKEWISPPESAVRIVVDTIEFCSPARAALQPGVDLRLPHPRGGLDGGAGAGLHPGRRLRLRRRRASTRGLDVDAFAPRLSFFFDIHNDFFEEVAKLRAARRIWATVMRERFGARKAESLRLRTHTQTAGVSATAQQPLNNVARVALQALAAVLGGAQSLHTNSYDEVLALPTEEAVTVALRTQQIIAEETGVALTVDPLGGLVLRRGAHRPDGAAGHGLHPRHRRAGRHRPRHRARATRSRRSPTPPTATSSWTTAGERTVVGVNKYVMAEERPVPYLRIDDAVEREQVERVTRREGLARHGAGRAAAQAARRGLPQRRRT